MKITLNITTEDGTLLGQVRTTRADLRRADTDPIGAAALVSDICVEAGVR